MLDIVVFVLLPFAGLYCIYAEQQKERPSWWKLLLLLILLVGYIIILSHFSGIVRAIAPFDEINKERAFFWGIFVEKLLETSSFSAAVEKMAVHIPQVEKYITHIAAPFVKTGVFLIAAGIVSGVAAVVMIVLNSRKKSAPWLLTAVIFAAFLAGGFGGHQYSFGEKLKSTLTRYLALQQDWLAEALKSGKPLRENREMAAFLPQYLKDTPKVFGESYERLEKGFFKSSQKD